MAQYLSILYPNETRALWEKVTWDRKQDDPFIPSWNRKFFEELSEIRRALESKQNLDDERNGVLVGIANTLGISWQNSSSSSNNDYFGRIAESLERIAESLEIIQEKILNDD